MLKGIDISNWQSGMNISGLDIDFLIAKATEGNFFVDPYCDGYISQAISNGLKFGFFHYAREAMPETEAKYFISNCRGYIGKGIPMLDYEIWYATQDPVNWCERFMAKFHDETGIWPLLYISQGRCSTFADSWIPEKCGLWMAAYPYTVYGTANTSWIYDNDYSPWPWDTETIWQFTDNLQIAYQALDGDIAYLDDKSWDMIATGGNIQNETEKQPAEDATGKKTITGKFTVELE